MMSKVNAKQLVLIVGATFVFAGLFGLLGDEQRQTTTNQSQSSGGQSSLEVKQGDNLPTSTINLLQGSGGIQNQGSQPQGDNAGPTLQPNSGATSLPRNY